MINFPHILLRDLNDLLPDLLASHLKTLKTASYTLKHFDQKTWSFHYIKIKHKNIGFVPWHHFYIQGFEQSSGMSELQTLNMLPDKVAFEINHPVLLAEARHQRG
jgi:hypothetical protein